MCKFTLDTLSPETLLAFYKNMDFHGSISKNFIDIREELDFFYKNYQVPENPFDFAWIGEEDRIFSAKKLIRYYEKEKVDRKSTRLNSSHANISYAVFCLKKN